MYGKSYAELLPHFQIFYNQQFINSGFVTEQDSVYQYTVSKETTDSLNYILINFDNDMSDGKDDRILYISRICLDKMDIDSIMLDNFFLPYIKNMIPRMNFVKKYLGDRGYDTLRVKLIAVNDAYNKTLALAKGAQMYFSKNEVKNINILTMNNHSNRSYINFKNCLERNMEVGCIPVKTNIEKKTPFLGGLDARGSLLLTWIYWWIH